MMSHRALYWTVIGLFAVVGVVMVFSFNYNHPGPEADAKAQKLVQEFESAGLPTPASTEQVSRVLRDDGGAVCANLSPEGLGQLKTRLGVGGEFYYRPTVVDRRVVEGLRLVAQVYCPDKLEQVQDFIGSMKFDDVVPS